MNKLENIDIIDDFFNLYNVAIDSYNSKIMQTINEKYTIVDKATLAMFVYIKILKKLDLENEKSKKVLISYLLRQTIYGETGNLDIEISDKSREDAYNEVIEKLIIEKFAYRNRVLKKMKYNYVSIENNEYFELLKFCEDIATFSILKKILNRGNNESLVFIKKLEEKLNLRKKELNTKLKNQDLENKSLYKEQLEIIQSIWKFEETDYYKLLEVGLNLRDVYRYSTLTTILPENVLVHQYTIAVISFVFAEYLNSLGENIDTYEIIVKSLFHDFGEYKGNEIVAQVKNYNQDTIDMFAEIEEKDEEDLREKIGDDIYVIIKDYKKGKEGYVSDIVDKMLGIMKLWIEIEYMNNLKYVKAICSIFQSRFKKFKRIYEIEDIKNKDYIMDILREVYIFIKESMIGKNQTILYTEFTEEEIKEYKAEIDLIRKDKKAFLA